MFSSSNWWCSIQFILWSYDFVLCFRSDIHNSVSSVQGGSYLLICLNESFKFDIQIFVLTLENITMGSNCINFWFHIRISIHEVFIAEYKVILLFSRNNELIVSCSQFGLSIEQLSLHISVSSIFILSLSLEITFLCELSIKISLHSLNFSCKSRMIIFSSDKLNLSGIKVLSQSSLLKILSISEFSKFLSSLSSFVKIIINRFKLGIIILTFSLLESNSISQVVNFILISCLFLVILGKFVLKIISIFSESISLITLYSYFSLKSNTFLLSSADLVSDWPNFSLVLVIGSIFLIEKESEVFNFFSEGIDRNNILIMSIVIIIILHQFFVLIVSVLCLDSVELVSQSKVVFVSVLNFKDFSFQLWDK